LTFVQPVDAAFLKHNSMYEYITACVRRQFILCYADFLARADLAACLFFTPKCFDSRLLFLRLLLFDRVDKASLLPSLS
jgi:hypothetical protein